MSISGPTQLTQEIIDDNAVFCRDAREQIDRHMTIEFAAAEDRALMRGANVTVEVGGLKTRWESISISTDTNTPTVAPRCDGRNRAQRRAERFGRKP